MTGLLRVLFPDIMFQPRDFTGNIYTKWRFGFGKSYVKRCKCGRKVKLMLEQDRMEVICQCGTKMELNFGDKEVLSMMRQILLDRWNNT